MKYELRLIIRIFLAFLIRPIFFYYSFLALTMVFPYLILYLLGYNVQFLFDSRSLVVNGINMEFVEACIATSAYYLLALLILTTKDINLKKSIQMFFLGSLFIFVMNIFRISLLIMIIVNLGLDWFNIIHLTFWYVLSSIYVLLVWVFLIRVFNVKSIPIYSDLVYLYKISRRRKND